eukprot:m.285049 g.285049  ORF g.285049 m.285049 type:complete len:376 (-) comp11283_c0_seq1:2481-3608(-)
MMLVGIEGRRGTLARKATRRASSSPENPSPNALRAREDDHLQLVLRVADLLAVGNGKGAALLAGNALLARQLLLGLLDLDGVTVAVSDLLELLELDGSLEGSLHPLGIAAAVAATVLNNPRLGAQGRAELVVVGDHDDAALVLADGLGKGTERLAVEVVGGLVENENLGLVPHGSANDDLDLLTTREGSHAVVGAKLAVETDILEVLLDVVLGEGASVHALASLDLDVDNLHVLGEAHLLELLGAHPSAGIHGSVLPLDLVLVLSLLAGAATAREALDNLLDLLDVALLVHHLNDDRLGALGSLLLGDGHRGLAETLLVLTTVVTPADVLVGAAGQVLLNVVEGVLGDIGDAEVGVLPDLTRGGLKLTGEELNQG